MIHIPVSWNYGKLWNSITFLFFIRFCWNFHRFVYLFSLFIQFNLRMGRTLPLNDTLPLRPTTTTTITTMHGTALGIRNRVVYDPLNEAIVNRQNVTLHCQALQSPLPSLSRRIWSPSWAFYPFLWPLPLQHWIPAQHRAALSPWERHGRRPQEHWSDRRGI